MSKGSFANILKVLHVIFNFLEDKNHSKMRRKIFIGSNSGSGRRKLKKLIKMHSKKRDGKFWPKKGIRSGKISTEGWRRLNKNYSSLKITWRKC